MTTRIEILALTAEEVRVAFYYPTPALPGSADPARTPSGKALAPEELQSLRDGTLFEVVKALKIEGRTEAEVLPVIEEAWAAHRPAAKARHEKRHHFADLVGTVWDGARWAAPAPPPPPKVAEP